MNILIKGKQWQKKNSGKKLRCHFCRIPGMDCRCAKPIPSTTERSKSPSCFPLRVPVSPYFSGHHSLGLLAHSLLSDSETVIKRTHCWRPAVTFLGRIQAKAGCGAFWRDQSVLNYRLEEDNILIRVMRKQIKWPQNMSLETPKLKDMTLLINMSLFSFCFKSL